MSTTLNSQLIDAVEAGREADVKRLIEAGASPDARKRVTLRAKVKDGRGGFVWMEDSVDCESALALGILHGNVAIVKVLLEKGAAVDGEVRWKISNYYSDKNWKRDRWEERRWYSTFSFPSPLALAVGRGGKWTDRDGRVYDSPNSNKNLEICIRGGAVTITHPEKRPDVYVTHTVRPSMEIVRRLLAHGARITETELNAARKNPDQEFFTTLEAHHQRIQLELTTIALAAQLQELTMRIALVEREVRKKEDVNQEVTS
ncbi:hypothetical protein M427DRAFT_324165 [Gonapodya prolifera JEL478]|uniref:Ankyrin n=1 Tax=Gonapodya prolifera (strain JEL478) TaxID=1344416 RepID=A0A139AEX2_GONPJ|nr:hypothetical protein M427DRAFT_324165 [Gonapodya prolifera JEL478]|eukprot:KXS15372.1 hypothetical protein M427DRAFT_324165 [Gonapodya prolifera JEL478]